MQIVGLCRIMICLAVAAAAGCASSGAVPRPFPKPDWNTPAATVPSASTSLPGAISPIPGAAADESNAYASPVAPSVSGLSSNRFEGRALAHYALGFRGVPYRLGGSDPGGFDCSGLVQYVFAQYGVDVPRIVEQQYEVGDKVKTRDIKPGDLLFFATTRSDDRASHVAISIGGDQFVHAPNSTGVVRIESLGSAYWGSKYIGARRLTPL
jgi:cell wall-associated NlpC family hydrolase